MNELGTLEKPKNEPRIDPAKRVANEDYFKALRDVKKINGPTKQTEKAIARTRFDNQASTRGPGDDGDEADAVA